MTAILLVGAGGFLGANIRYLIATRSTRKFGPRFPLGTLIANVSGSFLIGLVLGVIDDQDLRLFLATGFLGAETTFSTFAVETLALDQRGQRKLASASIALNVVGSLAAVSAGLGLAWLLRKAT